MCVCGVCVCVCVCVCVFVFVCVFFPRFKHKIQLIQIHQSSYEVELVATNVPTHHVGTGASASGFVLQKRSEV